MTERNTPRQIGQEHSKNVPTPSFLPCLLRGAEAVRGGLADGTHGGKALRLARSLLVLGPQLLPEPRQRCLKSQFFLMLFS